MRALVLCALLLAGGAFAQDATGPVPESEAQFRKALELLDGSNAVQDYSAAVAWLTKASASNHRAAQNMLARLTHEGLGVTQDRNAALGLFQQAAADGNPDFLFDFGKALESSGQPNAMTLAAQVYGQAVEQGHVDAMVNLGSLFQEGRGVAQDFAQAQALFEPAARQGHPRALNNLGLLYVRGNGVAQDYKKAGELFEAAASQGLPSAKRNLAVLLENGFGVPLDEARAIELYRQAGGVAEKNVPTPEKGFIYDARLLPLDLETVDAAQISARAESGDLIAQFQTAWIILQTEDAAFEDTQRAARYLKIAASAGVGAAMFNLGVLYFEGKGVPQDFMLGQKWILLAKRFGVVQDEKAAVYGAALTAAQINEAQARAAIAFEQMAHFAN